MVSNAIMTICDYDNPDGDKYEYDLSENENFEKLNAVEMGRLYRYGDGFKFQALGSGYVGGMTELFKNFGLDIDEGSETNEIRNCSSDCYSCFDWNYCICKDKNREKIKT